jgi:hypothetical protein
MIFPCSAVQFGTPVLYDVGHLQDFFSSCCHAYMSHCMDGHGLCREFQTLPTDRYLASPEGQGKSNASSSSFPAETSHVVLFCQSSDRVSAISQLHTQLLPGTRLTVLSCLQSDYGQVLEGTTAQETHDVLLSGPVMNALGITSTVKDPPHCYSSGLPLFRCLVQTGLLSVKEKPLAATCFDSFMLNTSQFVDSPDLSSTCIEFAGVLAGRHVRILLDSGASANFVDQHLVQELSLPTASISSPVTIRVADGRTTVVGSSVSVDLSVGSLDCRVTCLPTELAYYDLVLGKPWLTEFNPVVNWKLNAVSLFHADKTHVLLGSQRSGLPEYVVSAMEVEELVKSGDPMYLIQLNAVTNTSQDTNTYNVPELEELLQEFKDVLSGLPEGLPPSRAGDHHIRLEPDATPPASRIYPLSGAQLAELRAQLQELLERGFIRPSTSPFGAPILFVPKKDGGWRLCIDYRALNRITVRNQHPLPRIDEMFEQLHGSCVFSKLDLASGYHQIRMHEDSIEKTAFKTRYGHYEFTVMPFGLTNAPATFQSVMNSILAPFLDRFVLVYLDDILIYSKSVEEHMEHLRIVLTLLREHKFYCKRSKCEFVSKQVEYLGHLLTPQGIMVDPRKVAAIRDWPTPLNVSQLRGFLGLTQYYDTFIDHFADAAFPLTELLKKDVPWNWEGPQIHAFNALKDLVSSPPCLLMPDLDKPFVIHVDASGYAVGAVLQQDQGQGLQPVAFESRKLQPPERNLAPYDRELIALVHALLKWKHLLLGAKFTVHTDQQALKYLLTAPVRTSRQERWLTEIMRFMPDIKYVKGTDNVVADALSRRVDLAVMHVSSVSVSSILQEIALLCISDPTVSKLVDEGVLVLRDSVPYSVQSGKVYVPEALREKVLRECHATPFSGHLGINKMYELVCREFWWPRLSSSVRDFCRSCDTCQRTKGTASVPYGLLQPLPIPDGPWQSISLDLVTDLPVCCGFDSIVVFVHRFSKLCVLAACTKTITAPQLAQLFIDKVFVRFGMPTSIVSDRDPRFTSHFWKAFVKLLGTDLAMSTAYHPQTDGQTERMNRTMEDMLRGFVGPRQTDLCKYLSMVEFAYNNSLQASTLHTPFFLNYGRHPLTPLSSAVPSRSANPAVSEWVEGLQTALKSARSNLASAQQRQKSYADKKRRDHPFKVGDQVLLAARKNQLAPELSSKLSAKYFGPFLIAAAVGSRAFRLVLPETVNIHPVFHVSQLKPYVSTSSPMTVPSPPPLYADKRGGVYEVEAILAKRRVGKSWQYLVKWKGYDETENTWEPLAHVRHLADDVAAAPVLS